jgi:hypothetical protein
VDCKAKKLTTSAEAENHRADTPAAVCFENIYAQNPQGCEWQERIA